MAVQLVTPLNIGNKTRLYTWAALAGSDTGTPLEVDEYGDMTVTFEGTFDSGTVVLQGSNDGTNYYTVGDPQGNAISKTAAGMEFVVETPRYIRPSVSGGGGSCAIQCRIFARRS